GIGPGPRPRECLAFSEVLLAGLLPFLGGLVLLPRLVARGRCLAGTPGRGAEDRDERGGRKPWESHAHSSSSGRMVTYPSLTAAAGRLVAPRVRARLPLPSGFAASATVNGTPKTGGVPSPGSTVQLPEKTAVFAPDGTLLLARPSTTISRAPRGVAPIKVVWNWPKAHVPATESPVPTVSE